MVQKTKKVKKFNFQKKIDFMSQFFMIFKLCLLTCLNFSFDIINKEYSQFSFINQSSLNTYVNISEDLNYLIYNSHFINLESINSGGAISLIMKNTHLILNSCSFNQIKTYSQFGGAIYIDSTKSTFILYKILSFQCFSTNLQANFGQFSYSRSRIGGPSYFCFSSIVDCKNEGSFNESPIYSQKGIQKLEFLNISNNFLYQFSIYFVENTPDHYCKYSSFSNNFASSATGINVKNGYFHFYNVNFYNNTQGLSTSGIFKGDSNSISKIINCQFIQNQFSYLFHNLGEIFVVKSYIDNPTFTGTSSLIIMSPLSNSNLSSFLYFNTFSLECDYNYNISENNLDLFVSQDIFGQYFAFEHKKDTFFQNLRLSYTQNNNYNLSNCIFMNLFSPSLNGGAIGVNSGDSFFFIEYCFFSNCSAYSGGSIYFNSNSIVLSKSCFLSSYSSYNYISLYLRTKENKNNVLIFSSISKCIGSSSHLIYLYSGKQEFKNNNLSSNIASLYSGFSSFSPISFFLMNSLIFNCYSFSNSIIYLQEGYFAMNQLYFVSNTQISTNYGLIYIYSFSLVLKDSYFNNNSQFFLFNNRVGSDLYIINSYIDVYSLTGTFPKMTLLSSTFNEKNISFSEYLNHREILENSISYLKDTSTSFSYSQGSVNNFRLNFQPSGYYSVKNSIFQDLISSQNGGSIYVSGNLIFLVVSDSFFWKSIISSYSGGSIYFDSYSIRIIKICANECYSTSSSSTGQFLFQKVTFLNPNEMNFSTVISSNPLPSGSSSTFYFHSGNQYLHSTNVSNNNPSFYSIGSFMNPQESELIYCSFFNNYANTNSGLEYSKGINKIIFSQFINNSHTSTSKALIENINGAITSFTKCVFNSNCYYLFNNQFLLNVLNCFSDFFPFTGSLIRTGINYYFSSTLNLNHLNTQVCVGNDSTNQNINEIDDFEGSFLSGSFKTSSSKNIRFSSEIPQNYFIEESFFTDIFTILFHGSAISFSTSSSSLIITTSVFSNCSTSYTYGGSIYYSSNGFFLMKKICCSNCFCSPSTGNSDGQFLFSSTAANYSHKIYEVSIISCFSTNKRDIQRAPLYINNGNQLISNCNISNNPIYNSILYSGSPLQLSIISCYFINNFYQITGRSISMPLGIFHSLESNFINNSVQFYLPPVSKFLRCSFYSFGDKIDFIVTPEMIIDCYFSNDFSVTTPVSFLSTINISNTKNLPKLYSTFICVCFQSINPSIINLNSLNFNSLINPNIVVSVFTILFN